MKIHSTENKSENTNLEVFEVYENRCVLYRGTEHCQMVTVADGHSLHTICVRVTSTGVPHGRVVIVVKTCSVVDGQAHIDRSVQVRVVKS